MTEKYHKLTYYTLAHPDTAFIHQNVVDAFTAQNADEHTKPIALVFALLGLYLFLEKGFTGKQVQQAHMKLGRQKKQWPRLPLPNKRGMITVDAVLTAEPGVERDTMIKAWCESVWETYYSVRERIIAIVEQELFKNQ